MADKEARAIRMSKEHEALKPYVAKSADGEVLGFTAILPKPAAIIWRIGQTTFWRFDDEHQAKLFMAKFGQPEYRMATQIEDFTNA